MPSPLTSGIHRLGVAPPDCLGLPPGTLANFQIGPGRRPGDSTPAALRLFGLALPLSHFEVFAPERVVFQGAGAAVLMGADFRAVDELSTVDFFVRAVVVVLGMPVFPASVLDDFSGKLDFVNACVWMAISGDEDSSDHNVNFVRPIFQGADVVGPLCRSSAMCFLRLRRPFSHGGAQEDALGWEA